MDALSARAADWRLKSSTATGIRQLHMMVALIAPLLMLLTIAFMAQQQNSDALDRERDRATSLQRHIIAEAALLGLDNASWNDAYRAAVGGFDTVWMDESWGPDAFGTIDYHDVFLVDAAGRKLYASALGIRTERPAQSFLGSNLALLLRRARQRGRDDRATAFAPYAGGIGVVSVTSVRPVDPGLRIAGAPARYLVTVKRLDGAALRRLELASGFAGLRIAQQPEEAAIAFTDLSGRPFAWLAWESRAPGFASALAVLPVALFLFVLLAYAGIVGAGTASRWADQVLANEAAARRLAELDPLTELPNRRSFIERLQHNLADGTPMAVLYIDLDGFKRMNDVYGHLAGDALLVAAGERIALAVAAGREAQLARLGGDEFAIAVRGDDAARQAERIAHAVIEAFGHPVEHGGRQVYLGASLGLATGSPDMAAAELIRHADVAMYAAKAAGKRQWRRYEASMDAGRDIRQRLAVELREALQANAIEVSFQPIVAAQDERIVAAEALARWTSPTFGAVEPGLFISVAEESGLISDLTRQVLRKAARAAAGWDIVLAVNLSAAEVWDAQFADALLAILGETGLPAGRLELEITEGYLLREPEAARDVLGDLRSLGVQMALDDFGTGFASLTYLRKLPLDRLKLTREFLGEIVGEGGQQPLAAAIVQLGAVLGLPVTAEGVETAAQAEALRAAGCTRLQGWLYGKPMSADQLTRRLNERAAA